MRQSRVSLWTGWTLGGLIIAFCLMDGVMKLVHPQFVIDATREIGWPAASDTLTALGVVLLGSAWRACEATAPPT